MLTIYEARGETWLAELPQQLARYAAAWDFVVEGAVSNLSYNYVAKVRLANGRPAIFKTGVPSQELFTEMKTLALYNGVGIVRPLRIDHDNGACLLECITPGTDLSELADDDRATHIVAHIIEALRRSAPNDHALPHLRDWCSSFARYKTRFGDQGPVPLRLVETAVALANALFPHANDVLLHGDLHHYNILHAGGENWIAIDPKGVIGDAAFETARFLHNPYPQFLQRPDMVARLSRRIDIVCERLGFERDRVVKWGYVDTLLSSVWSVEDNDDAHLGEMLAFAEAILQL